MWTTMSVQKSTMYINFSNSRNVPTQFHVELYCSILMWAPWTRSFYTRPIKTSIIMSSTHQRAFCLKLAVDIQYYSHHYQLFPPRTTPQYNSQAFHPFFPETVALLTSDSSFTALFLPLIPGNTALHPSETRHANTTAPLSLAPAGITYVWDCSAWFPFQKDLSWYRYPCPSRLSNVESLLPPFSKCLPIFFSSSGY